MKNRWDSNNYTNNFQFVHKYGEGVLELLTVPKGSYVIDIGCGNGALTEKLAEKGYRTLAIDSSTQMLEKAKELHPELDFRLDDACEFRLTEKADAIFSNAVFHWIDDHDKLVKNISENLKSGGEFVFEFGGKGCAENVHKAMEQAFSSFGLKYKNNFNFRSIGEFAPLLEKHGFSVKYAVLYDRPTEQAGENGLENWINMFLGSAFSSIDNNMKAEIIKKVVEICMPKLYTDEKWFVDYVRLQMKAIKL
ncbi:MAG: class I SAM-dependent methyltransferase [Eubacterium sp.]|nr:class I SAM-dependent methyltransferase [Eubacterium sp.]